MKLPALAIVLASWIPSLVLAQGGDPIDAFAKRAISLRGTCGMYSITAAVTRKTNELDGCLENAKAELAPLYEAAAARLAHHSAGRSMLEDAYGYWLATMSGLLPVPGESRLDHDKRLDEGRAGLDALIDRVRREASAALKSTGTPAARRA